MKSVSAASFETVRLDREGAIAILTLNRPDQLNAMNSAMRREISEALSRIEHDSEVRALVVTGAGRCFSSGFDLKEQMSSGIAGTAEWRRVLWEEFATTLSVWRSRVPTIAL